MMTSEKRAILDQVVDVVANGTPCNCEGGSVVCYDLDSQVGHEWVKFEGNTQVITYQREGSDPVELLNEDFEHDIEALAISILLLDKVVAYIETIGA